MGAVPIASGVECDPALPISLVGLGLSYDLFGGQRNGLGKLIPREIVR
jgi:hypothetical protein